MFTWAEDIFSLREYNIWDTTLKSTLRDAVNDFMSILFGSHDLYLTMSDLGPY